MPQTAGKISGLADKGAADKFVAAAEQVSGVKMVNVNVDAGSVVITHHPEFNLDDVKKVAGDMGATIS